MVIQVDAIATRIKFTHPDQHYGGQTSQSGHPVNYRSFVKFARKRMMRALSSPQTRTQS
ncbi:hypothetical protein EV192_109135 [Actinocrispum wychmicini]|uniref:Uncharacterized protein n=1 Tax=Actinocrispum wychmicini TaxID=1213861 RepID=A0A4R2JJ33_9PSEU|nr:hypothetical protein EV192_109135 [Actinocrispum wychmicini]